MTEAPESPRKPKQLVETAEFLTDRWLEVEHIYLNLMQRLGVKTK